MRVNVISDSGDSLETSHTVNAPKETFKMNCYSKNKLCSWYTVSIQLKHSKARKCRRRFVLQQQKGHNRFVYSHIAEVKYKQLFYNRLFSPNEKILWIVLVCLSMWLVVTLLIWICPLLMNPTALHTASHHKQMINCYQAVYFAPHVTHI